MKIPSNIIIHHSGVSWQKNPDQFFANNSYHKRLWKFRSSLGFYLGYNYEINKMGYVRQARANGERTAACPAKSMNDGRAIHICLDGNFEIERPFPNEIYALRDLLKSLFGRYPIPKSNIFFHKQFAATLCPGKNLDLAFIRSLA